MVLLSSEADSEAEALDPLEPWQRRMVAKKMTQCKDEVVAHPHMMDLGYHLVVPAIPNRRKPTKEHHWLARKALLCRVPWGLSAGIAGPTTLPADLGYVGQGRNRFCYLVPPPNEHAQPSVLKLVSGDQSHGMEREAYRRLPLLCAQVFWEGEVRVKWPNSLERGVSVLRGLVQAKCDLAVSWLRTRRGSPEAEQFMCYAFIAVQYVRLAGFAVCDCGEGNLGVYALSKFPMVQFFDMQEWKPEGQAEYLTGFKNLVKEWAPGVLTLSAVDWVATRLWLPRQPFPDVLNSMPTSGYSTFWMTTVSLLSHVRNGFRDEVLAHSRLTWSLPWEGSWLYLDRLSVPRLPQSEEKGKKKKKR